MNKLFVAGKTKNRVFALAFALVWGGLVLFNLCAPRQAFSQAENRALAPFPDYTTQDLLNGDFMDGMNTYLSDRFLGRPAWVAGQSLWERGLGKREINDIYIGHNALYRHYPTENAAVSDANLDGVNAFARRYGVPTALMLVPSSTYIYRDRLPAFADCWDEGTYINGVYAKAEKGVTTLDVSSALEAERAGYIYYRTDHHWTSYGAWLGYREVARAFGLPQRDGELAVTTLSTDFLGTNHSRIGWPLVEPDTIERYEAGQVLRYETYGSVNGVLSATEYEGIYFPEYLKQKDQYSYFLGPIQPYVTIYTGADTGKKLIIFKDSYAHCLAPMLMADYSEIRLVDLRSLRADDYGAFVQAERYDEALFLYSTDTFSQQLGPGRLAE